MSRASLKSLAIACVAIAPLWAHAQLTANVSLTTNYKFRGQDQDSGRNKAVKPALQGGFDYTFGDSGWYIRSEEHTSELPSPCNLVCRLLLEKKKKQSQ